MALPLVRESAQPFHAAAASGPARLAPLAGCVLALLAPPFIAHSALAADRNASLTPAVAIADRGDGSRDDAPSRARPSAPPRSQPKRESVTPRTTPSAPAVRTPSAPRTNVADTPVTAPRVQTPSRPDNDGSSRPSGRPAVDVPTRPATTPGGQPSSRPMPSSPKSVDPPSRPAPPPSTPSARPSVPSSRPTPPSTPSTPSRTPSRPTDGGVKERPSLPPVPPATGPSRPSVKPGVSNPSSGNGVPSVERPARPSTSTERPSRERLPDVRRPEGRSPGVRTEPVGRPFTRPAAPPSPANGAGGSLPNPLQDDFGAPKGSKGGKPTVGTGTSQPEGRPSIVADLDRDRGDREDRMRRFRAHRDLLTDDSGALDGKLTGGSIGGVKVKPAGMGPSMKPQSSVDVVTSGGGTTIINDNSVNYITNVTYKNNSWGGHHDGWHDDWHGGWHKPWCGPVWGPGACWTGWDHDGFSLGLGFGSGGFSFSLFYSSWGTPMHTSWCDPWWDGWCGSVVVNCPPRYHWCRPCWSPCGAWYTNYVVYRGVPASWCTPVYAWTPTVAVPAVTTINNNYYYDTTPAVTSTVYVDPQPVTTVVTSAPVQTTAEVEAWDLLSNGFPRSSADSFAQLHDANPSNVRSLVGYGVALAMLEDIGGSATVMRQALSVDPGLVGTIPLSQQLVERIRLLESSAEVASRQSSMARDGLFLLGSWRAMQGRYTEAHLAILSAQQAGEDSLAAARLRSWLEARMTPRI